jgi:hypothetical protein
VGCAAGLQGRSKQLRVLARKPALSHGLHIVMPSAMIFCSCLPGAGSRVTAGRCYKKERQQVLVSCRDRSCARTDDSTPSAPVAARQTIFDRRNFLITSTLTTGLLYGAFPTAAIAEAELPLPPQVGPCAFSDSVRLQKASVIIFCIEHTRTVFVYGIKQILNDTFQNCATDFTEDFLANATGTCSLIIDNCI